MKIPAILNFSLAAGLSILAYRAHAEESAPKVQFTSMTQSIKDLCKGIQPVLDPATGIKTTYCGGKGGYAVMLDDTSSVTGYDTIQLMAYPAGDPDHGIGHSIQFVDKDKGTVEWRLADGKPFALIVDLELEGEYEAQGLGKFVKVGGYASKDDYANPRQALRDHLDEYYTEKTQEPTPEN